MLTTGFFPSSQKGCSESSSATERGIKDIQGYERAFVKKQVAWKDVTEELVVMFFKVISVMKKVNR